MRFRYQFAEDSLGVNLGTRTKQGSELVDYIDT